MKRHEFRKLALMGMMSGLTALGQNGAEAAIDLNSSDMQHMIAKPSCAAHGCAGIVAERDVTTSEANADADMDDDDTDGDKDADAKKKGAAKPAKPADDKNAPKLEVKTSSTPSK